MEQMLKNVFDYQRFFSNGHLSAIIEEVEKRYSALDEQELSMISAAGNVDITKEFLEKKYEHTGKNI